MTFDPNQSGTFDAYKPPNKMPAIALAILLCLALVGMLVCMVGCHQRSEGFTTLSPRSRAGSPLHGSFKLLRSVALLQDKPEHRRRAAVVPGRFLADLLKVLLLNGNRLPNLGGWFVHALLVLLVHTSIYTLPVAEFHLNSYIVCDFMKLYATTGVY